MKICSFCEGTGKLGFQREECCSCFGKGYIGKYIPKVFLGGTYESDWRNILIDILEINYINPIQENLNIADEKELEICDYYLYVVTPRTNNLLDIAKVVNLSNKEPKKTIFCMLDKDINPAKQLSSDIRIDDFIYFNNTQLNSLTQIGNMIEENGGKYFTSLELVAKFLNNTIF